MIELIYTIFKQKYLPIWMAFLILFLTIGSIYLIKAIPKIIQDNIKGKKEFNYTQQLQIESYFRDISGDKLVEVFSDWSDMIVNFELFSEEIEDTDWLNNLIKETILYGSDKTVILVSNFQHYNYTNSDNDDDADKDGVIGNHSAKILCYASCIISSLKHDFSGYDIDPLYLLKIKFNDFDFNQEKFKIIIKQIEQEVK